MSKEGDGKSRTHVVLGLEFVAALFGLSHTQGQHAVPADEQLVSLLLFLLQVANDLVPNFLLGNEFGWKRVKSVSHSVTQKEVQRDKKELTC